jgi:dUTP pyrophosphatase
MTSPQYVRLTENALSPIKGSPGAAGFDLRSAYNMDIPAGNTAIVRTDIAIELPTGCYGRIAPRSGLAINNHIAVGGGVVDSDYRGDVRVISFNHSNVPFHILKGDRVEQIICEQIFCPTLCKVTKLNCTERDSQGFGSTGM